MADMSDRWMLIQLGPTEDDEAFAKALRARGWSKDRQLRACAGFTLGCLTRKLLPMDEEFYRACGLSRAYTWADKEAFIFGYDWSSRHRCSTCDRRGRVGETEFRTGTLIDWPCTGCGKLVCIECALVIAGSSPPELHDDTWCSEECRKRGEQAGKEQGAGSEGGSE